MKTKENGVMIANTDAIQAIRDYLEGFASVSRLYKDLALAQTQVQQLIKNYGIEPQEYDEIFSVFDQHFMLTELMEPFMKDNGEETEA
jgi:hypothetical protein